MFCKNCGNEIQEKVKFCPHCGHNFQVEETTEKIINTRDKNMEEFIREVKEMPTVDIRLILEDQLGLYSEEEIRILKEELNLRPENALEREEKERERIEEIRFREEEKNQENNENINNISEEMNVNNNLTTCKSCGALVSKKAPNCPKCGNPIKKSKKGLGCAIGCLTPILIIILFIVGINITNGIKHKIEERDYNIFVKYIKDNGEYVNGEYRIASNMNDLLNTDSLSGYTLYSCVNESDEIFFATLVNNKADDFAAMVKVDCNRTGVPHKCKAIFNGVLSTDGYLTSYSNNTYRYSSVSGFEDGVDWFTRTLDSAARQIENFDIGITIYDLYGFDE